MTHQGQGLLAAPLVGQHLGAVDNPRNKVVVQAVGPLEELVGAGEVSRVDAAHAQVVERLPVRRIEFEAFPVVAFRKYFIALVF